MFTERVQPNSCLEYCFEMVLTTEIQTWVGIILKSLDSIAHFKDNTELTVVLQTACCSFILLFPQTSTSSIPHLTLKG